MGNSVKFKVGLFLIFSLLILSFAVVFILVKKDLFTNHFYYTLSLKSGEGITEGMPLLFSGFEIGKVNSLELDEKGTVIAVVKVPDHHAMRINKSSVFTLERPLIGSPRFIVVTEDLNAAPAFKTDIFEAKTVDDINEVIKKLQPMVEKVDEIATNIKKLTDDESNLNKTLMHIEKITGDLAKKHDVLEMLTGDKKTSDNFKKGMEHMSRSLGEVETLILNANSTLEKADEQILGDAGTVVKINAIVTDVDKKMVELDALIESLLKSGENLQKGTKDMDLLRKDLDMIINSVNSMVQDVRNALPIEQKKDVELP